MPYFFNVFINILEVKLVIQLLLGHSSSDFS